MSTPSIVSVEARALGVRFAERVALAEVSFELERGTTAAIIGPNGSGKTTLLHALAGILRPTEGTCRVDGSVAYVVQRHGTRAWMPLTAAEVVRMGRYRYRGLAGRLGVRDRAACTVAAERMEVTELLRRQFGELSGGQRQRVLVAMALAQEADVLLLDEPITGLDLASQQRILDLVAEERAAGRTVVLSTHHLDEARHCDTVLLLDGRLVAAGDPDAVLTEANLLVAYAGRLLGHHDHDHAHDLVVLDDHAHGEETRG